MKAILALSLLISCFAEAQTRRPLRTPNQGSARMPAQAPGQTPMQAPAQVPAQAPSQAPGQAPQRPGNVNAGGKAPVYFIDQGLDRILVSVDYNSWFEKLTINSDSSGKQEAQALFYGYGVNIEKNWYHPTWGWGIGGGLMTGRALGGDKAGTLGYFEPRVAWYGARIVPRIFYRWNPQADFGVDLVGMYKQSTWPDKTGDSIIKSGSDMLAGAFVDVRLRFNLRFEAIQSFGVLYKDQSTYWRLGLAYRL